VKSLGREIQVSPKVLDIIRNSPEGFSVTPAGVIPTSGYMVSLPGHSAFLPMGALTGPGAQAILQNYANAHAAPLSEPGAHFGGWHDTSANHVVLDVSHNVKDRSEAIARGRAQNQISIWDVKGKREIQTGGTGDQHG
jgi:hypothetical protein